MKKTPKNKSRKIQNKKVINKEGEKLYDKWKGYKNSFSSCIDKKRPWIK